MRYEMSSSKFDSKALNSKCGQNSLMLIQLLRIYDLCSVDWHLQSWNIR